MRASTAHFFKVPWTNAYDNLPAGLETQDDTATLNNLKQLYGSYSVDLTSNTGLDYRSFKSHNGDITVVVPIDAQTVLSQYNYVALEFDYTIHFYFINNVHSLFDNANNASCSIDLEYDIYLNNRRFFLSLDPQLCVRTHVKDLNYNSGTGKWSSNYRYIAPPVTVYETGTDSQYMVCWGRLCTSGDFYNSSGQTYVVDGCYPSQKITPYIMFPVFAINTETFEILDAYWQFDPSIPRQIDLKDIRVNNIEEILQFDLTYYPPFQYSIKKVGSRYQVRTQELNEDNLWTALTKESVLYDGEKNPYLYYTTSGGTKMALPCVTGVVSKASYTGIAHNGGSTPVRQKLTPSDTSIALSAPQLKAYPVQYHALYVNGSMIPLIYTPTSDPAKSTIIWEIDPSEVTPYLTIEYYGGIDDYRTKPIPLSNRGCMPTASSVYDSFIRANGNKIIAEQQAIYARSDLATASSVLSAAKGAVGSALSGSVSGLLGSVLDGASGAMNNYSQKELALDTFYAKLNDFKNAQDTYSIPSANAMSYLLQDLVLERAFMPADVNEVMSLFIDITYFGKEKSCYRSIIEPTHECYDYIQTAHAYFPQIPNLAHRRALEAAFNRGVTMWHYDLIDHYKTYYGDAVETMNRNVTNIQIMEV